MGQDQYFRFLLGLAIVVVVAATTFNRPSWMRSHATAGRYMSMLVTYACSQALVFCVLYSLAQRELGGFWSPSLVSLAATLFLVRVRPYDRWRKFLLAVAIAPGESDRLSKILAAADFHPGERRLAEARERLSYRGIDPDEIWVAPARPALEQFLKATVLFLLLRSWESNGKYTAFMEEARLEYDALRQRFDWIAFKISRMFMSVDRVCEIKLIVSDSQGTGRPAATEPGDERLDRAVKKVIDDMVGDLQQDVTGFLDDTCRLVARGVLTRELTESGRMRQLASMGLELTPAAGRVSYDPLWYAAGVLFLGLSVIFAAAARAPAVNISVPALVAMITLTQVAAFAIPVLPKLRWGFANSGISGRTPKAFVVGAGLVSVTFCVLVNLLFGYYMSDKGGWPGAIERLSETLRWLPMIFATAAVTAFLIQDHRWAESSSPLFRRLKDACVLAGAWSVVSLVVQLPYWPEPRPNLGPAGLLVSCVILGFILGYMVPGSFRERRPVPRFESEETRAENEARNRERRAAMWTLLTERRKAERMNAAR